FVLRVFADHADHAVTANHLALVANLLNGCSYLHDSCCFPSQACRPFRDSAFDAVGSEATQASFAYRPRSSNQGQSSSNWPPAADYWPLPYLYRYTIRPRVRSYGESST